MGDSSNLVSKIPASRAEFLNRGAFGSTSQQRMDSFLELRAEPQGNDEGIDHNGEGRKVLSLEVAEGQQSQGVEQP